MSGNAFNIDETLSFREKKSCLKKFESILIKDAENKIKFSSGSCKNNKTMQHFSVDLIYRK